MTQTPINAEDYEWFQNGPTTHLTTGGENSLCGKATVPEHVDTHPVEGGEYVCSKCADIAN